MLPHSSSFRSGLSRVEWLALTGIVVIFTVVGISVFSAHLEQAGTTRAVESAHTLNILLAQYATDNDNVYPIGSGTSAAGKSEGIARNLLANNYTPDASIFAIGSTPKYSGTSSDFSDLGAANLSWDFTAGATTTTGLTPAASDLLPTVYSTGQVVAYPTTAGSGLDLPLTGNGPFGRKGVVVAYKGGQSAFIKGTASGGTVTCPGFISTAFKDTATYTQIKP